MKERSEVLLAWKRKVLPAAACALLLLTWAGLLYLLARQRKLTEELLRLDGQMLALSRSCGLQAGVLPADPAVAGELKNLQRSRRDQERAATVESGDEKDMMMLMTYSLVPVRYLKA